MIGQTQDITQVDVNNSCQKLMTVKVFPAANVEHMFLILLLPHPI